MGANHRMTSALGGSRSSTLGRFIEHTRGSIGAPEPSRFRLPFLGYFGNQTPQVRQTADHGKDMMWSLSYLNVPEGHWLDRLDPIPAPDLE